jgi:hypothetical protein
MGRIWTMMALLGLATLGLGGCYIVSPYPYPYGAPLPAAPPPPPRAATPPPPAGGGAPAAPPAAASNCQTVTVEGYNRTHITPSGERVTIWIPAHTERVCEPEPGK